ncbi:hypothetical protein GYMLUDRAFT_38161 [Collybiopsis luxurians FD-317 M1]|nr:hypothetical protein GYMLUDRAFT_38161 [Collybiopsis luxurians FD-317 M1]
MSSSSYKSTPDSSSASSSSANLIPKTQKDYSAAFTNLQSTYGLTGAAASVPAQASKGADSKSSSSSSSGNPVSSSAPGGGGLKPSHGGKNYEEAFGNLYLNYGAPGGMNMSLSRK